jgi:hypothetical protein
MTTLAKQHHHPFKTLYMLVFIIIKRGEGLPLHRRFFLLEKEVLTLSLTGTPILMVAG